MLDEKLEYSEYTTPLKDDSVPRLKPDCFVSKYSKKEQSRATLLGLWRCLTIIARHFLFDEFQYQNAVTPEQQTEIISKVTFALKSWCGFLQEGEKSDYEFNGWLETYYKTYIMVEKYEKGLPSWEDIKSKKTKAYALPVFTKNVTADPSALTTVSNAVNYERVIAKAINEGPLRTYYLTYRKDFANQTTYKTTKENKLTGEQETQYDPLSGSGAIALKSRNQLLKLVSAYLIEKEKTGNDFVIVNLTDFSNWTQQKVDSAYLSKRFVYKDKPVFKFSLVNGNVQKLQVNPEYLEEYDFKLVEDKNISLPDNYLLLEDTVAGKN